MAETAAGVRARATAALVLRSRLQLRREQLLAASPWSVAELDSRFS